MVSNEMGINRATNLWFLSGLELLSSTRKAPMLWCCVAPGLPYHRGWHVWCRRGGNSSEAAESTMPFLSWHETKLERWTLFWASVPCFSTVCIAHLKTREAIARELLGTDKLARPLITSIYTEPPTPITETAAKPTAIPSPGSICLPRTNTICQTFMWKNAQEMPLVRFLRECRTFDPLHNSHWIPLCEPIWCHHFRSL